jgi:hypothetical protein
MRMALMDNRDTRAGTIIAERVNHLEIRTAWLISAVTSIAPLALPPPAAPAPPAPAAPP